MPLYLSAQIILHFREELLNNVECEYSAIHGFLTNIPQTLPFESLIKKALILFNTVPPKRFHTLNTSVISLLQNKLIVFVLLLFLFFGLLFIYLLL